MKKVKPFWLAGYLLTFLAGSCSTDAESEAMDVPSRNFSMGFTTWSFGPNLQDVNDTYDFIGANADVYIEHLDGTIPWNAYINDLPLPSEFTNEMQGKASRRIPNKDLVLSIGLLNNNRDNLEADFDGSVPAYNQLNDVVIVDAYDQHVNYLLNLFVPDYLVIAIEVNELRLRNPALWESYVLLINQVIERTRMIFPDLKISISISLHNLFEPNIAAAQTYINDVFDHVNQMDFVAISYYPFLKNQRTVDAFQATLDFLHDNTSKPIALVESGHIAEDLLVPNLNVDINGSTTEQNAFLKTLFTNAQTQNYEMVVWWAHRDYDALWEVFPPEVRDIGQLWRDTGLLDENGSVRPALITWENTFFE
ncbi:MAG: glycosyl hydrolase 53 family protein [Bacteroidota bacterium]